MPSSNHPDGLYCNLLHDPVIGWRDTAHGQTHRSHLPEVLAAMVANEVRDFPALRPHQRHPWHAFLVQLGAIALHHAGESQPWQSAAYWRAALLALTPNDPDGAPWCLVSPPDRPALLQAPVLKGISSWDADIHTPDRLDMGFVAQITEKIFYKSTSYKHKAAEKFKNWKISLS